MADVETGTQKHIIRDKVRRAKLYAAAKSGDWNAVEETFVKDPDATKEKLNLWGETPLHVAVAARQDKFVKELVEIMDLNDLAIRTVPKGITSSDEDTFAQKNMEDTESGDTAFSYAAKYGYEYGIRIMWKKNPELVNMKDGHGRLSVSTAALNGHQVIVYLLYYNTPTQMADVDLFHLVVNSIKGGLYGFAQRVLTRHLFLVKQMDHETQEKIILYALARSPISTASSNSQHQYQGLLSLIWDQITIKRPDDREQTLIDMLGDLIFLAAEEGNAEFISMVTDSYIDLFMRLNENKHTVFHIAVLSRFRNIFNLIHELGSIKDWTKERVDVNDNNMLHLAGYLPSSSSPQWKMIEDQNGKKWSFDGYLSLLNRLNDIPGAALQLQYELAWFQEVEKVMHPHQKEAKNKDKLSPSDLFFKEHENLRKAGEEWMRNTATSCMVVATLIATVVFAAAFTVPGGNGQDDKVKKDYGIPIFLHKPAFKVFAISDAISLVSSISTVLSFLSILTSRYSINDFRLSLPSKLILGLFFLFISVIAMMITFVAAFLVSFENGKLGLAYPIAAISSIPICLFVWQHARLFYQVIRSTFIIIWTRMTCQLRKIFPRSHRIKLS